MEARREKLIQARASFQGKEPIRLHSKEKEVTSSLQKKDSHRHIFLVIRTVMAIFLFVLYIYGVEEKNGKLSELSRKSCQAIQKNEFFIEKCSAFLGEMW